MYAVTSIPLVSFTRATLRSAEFGFLGVVVYTRVHTPRRCGLPLSAAVLVLVTLSWRPLRTSCWIVGMDRLSLRLLFLWRLSRVWTLSPWPRRNPRSGVSPLPTGPCGTAPTA